MLLGKRPRHQIKRTTSMTEFAFDPVEFAVTPPASDDTAIASAISLPATATFLEQSATVSALVSPRVSNRRYSADYGNAAAANHFLKSCSLCKRRFIPGRDIYMYRGDSAFCSLECRQQKISQDERKERAMKKMTPPIVRAAKEGGVIGDEQR